jgi:hypothetical protein
MPCDYRAAAGLLITGCNKFGTRADRIEAGPGVPLRQRFKGPADLRDLIAQPETKRKVARQRKVAGS